MAAPLQGIRVVDMTSVMMGPYATQILADFGADIIKVESLIGDSMRAVGPMVNSGMGCLFLHANRNKRSIAIDLKTDAGRDVISLLLEDADVVVSNIRSESMRRLRLSYADVQKINPSIIYVEAYGFGSTGTYAGKPAYDDLIQGLAAIPSLAMLAGSSEPRYAPSVIADRVVGLNIVNVVLAALVHKEKTSEGQHVEVPMFETLTHMVLGDHMGGASFIPKNGEMGYARLLSEHRRPYRTADGYICVVVYTDAHWKSFLSLTGDEQLLISDERFASLRKRTEHINELYDLVAQRLKADTSSQWLEALNKADIPAMPMHTPESLLNDPHLQSVGFFYDSEHPTEGTLRQMRMPSTWSSARRECQSPAPRLGEHTIEVLREYGISTEQMSRLLDQNIVHQAQGENLPSTQKEKAK